ncbi:hypothetical protein [Sphingobacterium bovistauri]|uniref:DUF5045 domain-containing protein n=1 Tax=Sphingobacterium bovistauri TaxID=2781959 RepID=A0ABS7ZBQ5_9SPHI|nr:hypothetical protein [Sphingobacterium bovistauri]MCA5006149.1 hypothetical protein [Sphingobacterium bovistauri]
MKLIVSILLFLATCAFQQSIAQTVRYLTDQHIVNQQQRMVYKQWDSNKFTPTKGFLGLNPNYWLTWAWHPNYPRKDLRPLSASGPQTQRLLLVVAMKNTVEAYKKHTDTLRNLALSEITGYSGATSIADPLWQIYYQNELKLLMEQDDPLQGSTLEVKQYMTRTGALEWYTEEMRALAQRLNSTRSLNMERESSIMTYHLILQEYRQLLATWDAKKQRADLYLKLSQVNAQIKGLHWSTLAPAGRSDRQIADDILSKSKF